ncbi:MAG: ASKHA domain-containing protein [Desulfococcaceae bacterium]
MTEPNVSTRLVRVELTPPSLGDNTADADRLIRALKRETGAERISADLSLFRRLPFQLREWNFQARCVVVPDRGRHVLLGVSPPDETRPAVGLAVDLGTTRVVLRLVDLGNGTALGETAFDNPQIAIGPDVLTRIHHADTESGLGEMQTMVVEGINAAAGTLLAEAGLSEDDLFLVAVAGNTAMTHLFMGLPPRWIIREPYIPAVNNPGLIPAAELGIAAAPEARVLVFPNVGSYFGGDLIAGVLHAGMNEIEETAILVDVGTNAEVILGNRDWLIACAGAAGPALESGVARMGMMAAPGVIDAVSIDPETKRFDYHTIGDLPPRGMCGSGIIDLAAALFLSGMLTIQGKLNPEACGERYREEDGRGLVVAVPAAESATGEDLVMRQADIDSLVRSKAAMYTILETITLSVGLTPRDLTTFYVAGTFGSFIRPDSAIAIGMIPDLPREAYISLGNSSLGGAARALADPDPLAEIDRIRDRITYIELNVNQELMNRFSAARFLPHTDPGLFPSVRFPGR